MYGSLSIDKDQSLTKNDTLQAIKQAKIFASQKDQNSLKAMIKEAHHVKIELEREKELERRRKQLLKE